MKDKKLMGRPQIPFDWDLVDGLLALNASEDYVAERLLIQSGEPVNDLTLKAKIRTMQRRIRLRWDMTFVEYRKKKLEGRNLKLAQLQLKAAEKGSAAMLIWLGKQWLGQADKSKHELSGPDGKPIEHMEVSNLSEAQLKTKIRELIQKVGL